MAQTLAKESSAGHDLREFVVTIFGAPRDGGPGEQIPTVLRSQVWHSRKPMGLGHPLRWVLEKTAAGVRIRDLGTKADEIVLHPFREVPLDDLYRESPITLDGKGQRAKVWVTIRPVLDLKQIAEEAAYVGWKPQAISAEPDKTISADRGFKIAALLVLAAGLLLGIKTALTPAVKVDPKELIPPQFAKVLLSPAVKAKAGGPRAAAGRKSAPSGTVVQAFQSAAVQKTTRSLLNAGLAKALLTKSTLLDQVSSKAVVQKVFEGKSSLKALGKVDVGRLGAATTKMDLLGGGNGKGSASAGYGNSQGVALTGQGDSWVGVGAEGFGVQEGLSKDEVGKVIREHISEVRYCYEAAMVRQPGFEGRLSVTFIINRAGAVKSAATRDSSGDRAMDCCILSRLQKWKFPAPRGGVDVGVTYPFIFKSLGN
jgi:TonB family protein